MSTSNRGMNGNKEFMNGNQEFMSVTQEFMNVNQECMSVNKECFDLIKGRTMRKGKSMKKGRIIPDSILKLLPVEFLVMLATELEIMSRDTGSLEVPTKK